jgi:hypothetical protein
VSQQRADLLTADTTEDKFKYLHCMNDIQLKQLKAVMFHNYFSGAGYRTQITSEETKLRSFTLDTSADYGRHRAKYGSKNTYVQYVRHAVPQIKREKNRCCIMK